LSLFPQNRRYSFAINDTVFYAEPSEKQCLVDLASMNFDSGDHVKTCRIVKESIEGIFAYLFLQESVQRLQIMRREVERGGWITPDYSDYYKEICSYESREWAARYEQVLEVAETQTLFSVSDEMRELHQQWVALAKGIKQANEKPALVYRARCFPKEQSGYVYLFKLSTGHYKIGLSKKPQRRGREIISGLPLTIELIHQIPSNQTACLEDELHRKYAIKRHDQTEWFELDQSEVDEVMGIGERNYEWVNNPVWEKYLKPECTSPTVAKPSS